MAHTMYSWMPAEHSLGRPAATQVLANAAKFQMTPRITTRGKFDAAEQKFKIWVGKGSKGRAELWKAWHDIDYNGNGRVSLAEIDKWVVDSFDALLNNKPALMRAYKASIQREPDGFVHKMDFPILLRNILYFNKLWLTFEHIDLDNDRRLTFAEFRAGLSKLGLSGRCDAHTVFAELDTNNGGVVLFEELCKWVAARECPVDGSVYDHTAIAAGQAASQAARGYGHSPRHHGHSHGHSGRGGGYGGHTMAASHQAAAADAKEKAIEDAFRALLKDKLKLNQMWRRIDYNGNGIVSLAEIDKLVNESYPILYNKPALMRAFKAATRRPDGYIHKPELPRLLRNLLYFNKVWKLYGLADADGDMRLSFQEFQSASSQLGLALPPGQARGEFDFMDSNNGGMVLFDEFCRWVAEKKMPIE